MEDCLETWRGQEQGIGEGRLTTHEEPLLRLAEGNQEPLAAGEVLQGTMCHHLKVKGFRRTLVPQ